MEVEELYYPCSENKGADQLRSYCEADLRLCFRIGIKPVFIGIQHLVICKKAKKIIMFIFIYMYISMYWLTKLMLINKSNYTCISSETNVV